ncbi:MAG TPA: hypothetical protein VGR15_00565 [Bacteroidota bacterium]|nr:hypothetical protein [Bacteroidota bacterium]
MKAFHIFFITLSVLSAFGFAVWLMIEFTSNGNKVLVAGAVLSFVSGIGLILYGVRFLKKLRHVSFL